MTWFEKCARRHEHLLEIARWKQAPAFIQPRALICPICKTVLADDDAFYLYVMGPAAGCRYCVDEHMAAAFSGWCAIGDHETDGYIYTRHGTDQRIGCDQCILRRTAAEIFMEELA